MWQGWSCCRGESGTAWPASPVSRESPPGDTKGRTPRREGQVHLLGPLVLWYVEISDDPMRLSQRFHQGRGPDDGDLPFIAGVGEEPNCSAHPQAPPHRHLPRIPVIQDDGSAVQVGIGAFRGLTQMTATVDTHVRRPGGESSQVLQRFAGRDDVEPIGAPNQLSGLRNLIVYLVNDGRSGQTFRSRDRASEYIDPVGQGRVQQRRGVGEESFGGPGQLSIPHPVRRR